MLVTEFAATRIVQGTTATLSAQFVDQEGEPRVPGTVTVQVTGSDGTVLVPAGTTTQLNGDEQPTISVTPQQTAQLDFLTGVWTETGGAVITTLAEVVGGRYFTIFDARSLNTVLQDVSKYPDEDLFRARYEVELELERITGRSFVPRFRMDEANANSIRNTAGDKPLHLSQVDVRSIRWVKINGVMYASTYWELTTAGQLYFGRGIGLLPEQIGNGPWRGNLPVIVTAGYEYGWSSPPDDLKRAMLSVLRSRLLAGKSGVSERATSVTADGTTYGISNTGTGVPMADDVYESYKRQDWKDDFIGSVRII